MRVQMFAGVGFSVWFCLFFIIIFLREREGEGDG